MWLYPVGRACRPNNHRNAHTETANTDKKSHTDVQRTLPFTHWCPANTNTAPPSHNTFSPQTTTVSRGKEQRPHSNTRRIVYTLQTQASESHTTDTAQRNTTNTNKENSLELQPIGSRDTNTELPHKASYWITLLSSLHSAVKPAWRARQNTERLYELKSERTVDEHWRTPHRGKAHSTHGFTRASATHGRYTQRHNHKAQHGYSHSHSLRNTARVHTKSQQQNTLRYKIF